MTWVRLLNDMYDGYPAIGMTLKHRAGDVVKVVEEGDPPGTMMGVQHFKVADMETGYLDWDDYDILDEGETTCDLRREGL